MGLKTAVQQLGAVLLSAMAMLSMEATAAENYYKWVDRYGTTQYTQTPPPANARQVFKRVTVSTHVPADMRNRPQPEALAPDQSAPPDTPVAPNTPTEATPDQPAIFSSDAVAPAND